MNLRRLVFEEIDAVAGLDRLAKAQLTVAAADVAAEESYAVARIEMARAAMGPVQGQAWDRDFRAAVRADLERLAAELGAAEDDAAREAAFEAHSPDASAAMLRALVRALSGGLADASN